MSVRGRSTGRKQVRRRAIALTMLVSLLMPKTTLPVRASVGTETLRFVTSGVTTASARTPEELRCRWDVVTVPARRYRQDPCAPGQLGVLTSEFIRQNLEFVNLFRYSAGLPFVSCTDGDNRSAQHGAVLLAATNTLDHHPGRPSGMDEGFYQKGCEALCCSNISYAQFMDAGEQKKCAAAVPTLYRNYMNDCGAFNRSCVPHRRWILYPALQTVGIGCADAADGTVYQVLKVTDTQGGTATRVNYDFVAWPASGAFPAQAICPGVPWSVSLNPGIFEIPARDELTVTVTREADGKCWKLDSSAASDSACDSFLLVDTQRYGVGNCILFAFDEASRGFYQGVYRVCITGLRTQEGREAMLDYQVSFVDMEACPHCWSDWITDTAATCTRTGSRHRICETCGQTETELVLCLGHKWKKETDLKAPQRDGTDRMVCARCGMKKTDALSTAACEAQGCPSFSYSDAPVRGSWAHNGVDFVLENGIFNGVSPGIFDPKGHMTRAMMVTVLWRIAGRPAAKSGCAFRDVEPNAYYTQAVCWASENKLVRGYSAGRFGPTDLVTRAQAVTILRRYFAHDKDCSGNALADFSDGGAVESYARDAFHWAVENHVITGQSTADGRLLLLPDDYITREQAAAILMRCMMNP